MSVLLCVKLWLMLKYATKIPKLDVLLCLRVKCALELDILLCPKSNIKISKHIYTVSQYTMDFLLYFPVLSLYLCVSIPSYLNKIKSCVSWVCSQCLMLCWYVLYCLNNILSLNILYTRLFCMYLIEVHFLYAY